MAEAERDPASLSRSELPQLLAQLRRRHGLDPESGRRSEQEPQALGQVLQGLARRLPGGGTGPPAAGPVPARAGAEQPAPLEPAAEPADDAAACPYNLCAGRGWYVSGTELVAPCRCVAEYWSHQALARRLAAARLPARLAGATLGGLKRTPHNGDALGLIATYLAQWPGHRAAGEGFGVIGPVGAGKTHLLVCVCNELIGQGCQVLYISMINAFSEIARGYRSEDLPDPEDVIAGLRDVEFLALDDLGAEGDLSPWERKKLLAILDHRYQFQLPTAFTSNLDLPALNAHLGERAFSRLISRCKGRVALLSGPDLRIFAE